MQVVERARDAVEHADRVLGAHLDDRGVGGRIVEQRHLRRGARGRHTRRGARCTHAPVRRGALRARSAPRAPCTTVSRKRSQSGVVGVRGLHVELVDRDVVRTRLHVGGEHVEARAARARRRGGRTTRAGRVRRRRRGSASPADEHPARGFVDEGLEARLEPGRAGRGLRAFEHVGDAVDELGQQRGLPVRPGGVAGRLRVGFGERGQELERHRVAHRVGNEL